MVMSRTNVRPSSVARPVMAVGVRSRRQGVRAGTWEGVVGGRARQAARAAAGRPAPGGDRSITVRHVFTHTSPSFLDADHARRYETGLARLAKPYRLQGTEMVRGLYPIVRDQRGGRIGLQCPRPREVRCGDRRPHPRPSRDARTRLDAGEHAPRQEAAVRSGLVRSVSRRDAAGLALRLLAGVVLVTLREAARGDVIRSPFANSFLRIFVREASLGRGLPDPRWSQPSDRFNAEIEQLAPQAGNYRYDAERGSHELLTRWLDDRRRAAPR
jgi:hypothetical protein